MLCGTVVPFVLQLPRYIWSYGSQLLLTLGKQPLFLLRPQEQRFPEGL